MIPSGLLDAGSLGKWLVFMHFIENLSDKWQVKVIAKIARLEIISSREGRL